MLLDEARPVTVVIAGDEISGATGCNSYSGAIDRSIDVGFRRFVVSDPTWTERACTAALTELEQALLAALHAVDSFEAAERRAVAADATPSR